jgi:dihydrofolate synthase/folylpolyglutamate synthase
MKVKQKKSLKDWLNQLETKHNKKIDLGLTRLTQVYNNLQLNKIAETVITVAGTNGKGSTVAILSSICQSSGYKVGTFTSPHIINFNERIKINDCEISDELIIDAFEKIESHLETISLSYFEYATLAALIIFKQQAVEVCVLEVGLGGRLDSVNIVDTDCAIITTIDIDHTDWLGDNKESIGYEKAGIMRPNKPIIYGDSDCPKSIINYANKISARLVYSVNESIELPELNIQGDYQRVNAKTALVALDQCTNLSIKQNQILEALQNIKLQGRLQKISNNPSVIVDVAHNKQAAQSLANWLRGNPISGDTIAVFAVLADKEPMDWLSGFNQLIDTWCVSSVDSERAMPTKDLLLLLADSAQLITSFESVSKALIAAKKMASKDDRILVFGSFYTVSEVMHNDC